MYGWPQEMQGAKELPGAEGHCAVQGPLYVCYALACVSQDVGWEQAVLTEPVHEQPALEAEVTRPQFVFLYRHILA